MRHLVLILHCFFKVRWSSTVILKTLEEVKICMVLAFIIGVVISPLNTTIYVFGWLVSRFHRSIQICICWQLFSTFICSSKESFPVIKIVQSLAYCNPVPPMFDSMSLMYMIKRRGDILLLGGFVAGWMWLLILRLISLLMKKESITWR